jgi:endonuclease YncB( thermonuclease family)
MGVRHPLRTGCGCLGAVLGATVLMGVAVGLVSALGSSSGNDSGRKTVTTAAGSTAPSPPSGSASREPQPKSPSSSPEATAKRTLTTRPEPAAKPRPAARTYVVSRVVDGDTLDLADGAVVRLVGIDTPERGQCGYSQATANLDRLVGGKRVTLGLSDEDHDRYGRLLRYVNIGRMDAGLRQIKAGLAIARYDSRDGYGFHPREALYITTDSRTPSRTACTPRTRPSPTPPGNGGGSCAPGYSPCLAITDDLDCADVPGPVTVTGQDQYGLDRDGDGVGCDA